MEPCSVHRGRGSSHSTGVALWKRCARRSSQGRKGRPLGIPVSHTGNSWSWDAPRKGGRSSPWGPAALEESPSVAPKERIWVLVKLRGTPLVNKGAVLLE